MEINESFKKVLKEEQGIADDVEKTSQEVFDLIKQSIKNKEYSKNDYGQYVGNIKFKFLNTNVSLSYEYVNFKSKTEYDYSSKGKLGYGSSVFIDKRLSLVNVQVCAVNGSIVKDITVDTVQHELEHIYQQLKMGREFGGSLKYARIKNDMQYPNESIQKKASILVYGCFKSEQEGYANGLYSFLMSKMGADVDSYVYESPAWKLYKTMRNIFEELKINSELYTYICKKYNLNMLKIERCLNNFLHRIARIVLKARYDKYAKQNWRN